MRIELTKGNILKKIIILALPIMGTSLIQSAYSMTDMIWVGTLGSRSVTAVGTAGFFTWFAFAFITIPQIGAAVGVAQSVGRKDIKETRSYIRHSIQMNIVFAVLYGITLIIFREQLVGFFNIKGADIVNMATNYLAIVSMGMIFFFLPPVLTAIFNGHGDSRTPFKINILGLIVNIILDPLLILGIGPFPKMGVPGAAVATIFAQTVVTIIFIYVIKKKTDYFDQISFLQKPDWNHMNKIVKFGLPVAVQSGVFTFIAMIIARILSRWGSTPIAVQSVGSQIESITWMTAGGFQTALSAFVGQNFGAKKWDRIYKGYFTALGIIAVFGTITSCLLIFLPGPIFSIFISEKEVIKDGIMYLRILGVSQIFMCIEMTTTGAFNGLGRTVPPSIVGIVLNAMRIPGALLFSVFLGLSGVWWSISISSILKGLILTTWFIIFLRRHPQIRGKNLLRNLTNVEEDEIIN
ncbi:MATE family efflux transporter [Clostridium lacusfryxellense]|uniref:MATE family efflux transporter n=1 Tax=Clostridium lacusfryxellense TaxID=205328 RepID=UPI001C0B2EB0|nr:MATE family efflux transporter [Clostridium lacusfryxellense]MBU3110267.1 MATE family efflux transporter [Clostridium lacusfryxellense]